MAESQAGTSMLSDEEKRLPYESRILRWGKVKFELKLEPVFWQGLLKMSAALGTSDARIAAIIKKRRVAVNHHSAVRVTILRFAIDLRKRKLPKIAALHALRAVNTAGEMERQSFGPKSKTSVSLESDFRIAFNDAAAELGTSMQELYRLIETERKTRNRSSTVRISTLLFNLGDPRIVTAGMLVNAYKATQM